MRQQNMAAAIHEMPGRIEGGVFSTVIVLTIRNSTGGIRVYWVICMTVFFVLVMVMRLRYAGGCLVLVHAALIRRRVVIAEVLFLS